MIGKRDKRTCIGGVEAGFARAHGAFGEIFLDVHQLLHLHYLLHLHHLLHLHGHLRDAVGDHLDLTATDAHGSSSMKRNVR
jgi:hypothetical protein